MTTAVSASLAQDKIVIGCDFARAVIVEPIAGQSAADVVTALTSTSASITGVGGTFPTGFVGGETWQIAIDGVGISGLFTVDDQTAADCVARIEAVVVNFFPGYAGASVSGGQIAVASETTGASSSVEVVNGTGIATLGLTGLTSAGTAASAAAVLMDTDGSTTLATATATVTAATRTISLSLTDTVTALLATGPARWRIRVTTATGAVWPVQMPAEQIRALP